MTTDNVMVQVSGENLEFLPTDTHSVNMSIMLAQSGTAFLPVRCDDAGRVLIINAGSIN